MRNGVGIAVPIRNGRLGKVVYPKGPYETLSAIACRSSAECYALGSGVVIISRGNVGQPAPLPFSANGAWCNRSHRVAVGSNGRNGVVYPFT
jgi:hypothetical protein